MGQNHPKPPISSHGLFPVIVAIWFSALFGFGCLVLPAVLLERAADGSGIAALVPAAAPPLGVTARILLASGAGVFGALLGFIIARRVAAAQANVPPANSDRRLRFAEAKPAPNVRRPISAQDELGTGGLDKPARTPAAAPIPGRKRPLAMAEETGPSDFLQLAPLPGQPEHRAGEHPLMPSAAAVAERTVALHADEHGSFAAVPAIIEEPGIGRPDSDEPDRGMAALRNAPLETAAPEPSSITFEPRTDEPGSIPTADQPLNFTAPSQVGQPSVETQEQRLVDPLRALLAGQAAPVDKLGGPLERLGMVELAERLARSMQERVGGRKPPRSLAAKLQRDIGQDIGLTPPAEPAAATVDATPNLSVDSSPAGIVVPPPAIPAALRPFTPEFGEFDEDEDEVAASFSLPFARTAPIAPAFAEPVDAASAADEGKGEDEDLDEDQTEREDESDSTAYSSLLTMKNPLRAPTEFVRIDVPEPEAGEFEPAVVFPEPIPPAPDHRAPASTNPATSFGVKPSAVSPPVAPHGSAARPFDAPPTAGERVAHSKARPDPAETERALRSALATLQRMSGVA